MRPYLLLDVDGVLNPDFSNGSFRKRQKLGWYDRKVLVRGELYRVFFNPAYGPQLLQLAEETGAELAWATTWRDEANEFIGPAIGLPELPVIPCHVGEKPENVAAWVGDRPFTWLDDDYEVTTSPLIRPPSHVVWVDSRTGLTDRNLDDAKMWLSIQWAADPPRREG